jgi:type VI secretion system protein ImpK
MDVVDELTRDCFGAVIQLRRMAASGATIDPQLLYQRLCWFVDTMIQRAREAQVGADDLGDIVYAIVALADEVALSVPGAVQQFWMYNLLQLRYFNENLAGENFYRRLETLRADPRRYPILRIYYLCLLFGFQGRYRVRGGEIELSQLVETLRLDLARHKIIEEEVLAPHGGRPQQEGSLVRRNLPVLGLAIAAVVVAVGLNLALHVSLGSRTDDVVERIQKLANQRVR